MSTSSETYSPQDATMHSPHYATYDSPTSYHPEPEHGYVYGQSVQTGIIGNTYLTVSSVVPWFCG